MIALSVFLPHILRIQHSILRIKYIDSTDLYPKLYKNQHAKILKLYALKISGNFWNLIYVGAA